MSRKQPFLPGFSNLGVKEFGGALLKGNPREPRPISVKRPMHLVMRSSLAKGERSFLSPVRAKRIEEAIRRVGAARGVKVYRYSNAGNHLHLVILPRSREAFRAFIRGACGIVARITLGVERGSARGQRFWDARPFSRIVEWGRDFDTVGAYLRQNTLEAIGFVPYRARKHKTRLASAAA